MAISLGGMGSVQRLQTIARGRGDRRSGARRPTRCACSRWRWSSGSSPRFDSLERVLCTGEPGASLPAVRARIEEGSARAVIDHAGLTEAGPFGYPCPEGHGLHVDESEFVCEILDDGPAAHGPGRARRAA